MLAISFKLRYTDCMEVKVIRIHYPNTDSPSFFFLEITDYEINELVKRLMNLHVAFEISRED